MHSRSSSGEKQSTDINVICDEYLRLAYNGFRAKDKSFDAEIKLNLDPELPKVDAIPQDIGRALLNLINNAFDAVAKTGKPAVEVSTRKGEKAIEIRVKDNGTGIPDHLRDKIFQPFFTTKPTGQGTGLGLSLTYDIVTKGYGGTIMFDQDAKTGTVFTITIPLTHAI
jgi:signal transduction histidine kinase